MPGGAAGADLHLQAGAGPVSAGIRPVYGHGVPHERGAGRESREDEGGVPPPPGFDGEPAGEVYAGRREMDLSRRRAVPVPDAAGRHRHD